MIKHLPLKGRSSARNICIYSPFYSWILCYKTRPSSSFILHLECFILLLLFSHSVVSDSLWPHGLQHARLPCPSPSPGACSNLCPLSWWCHTTILSSVVPLLLLLSIFPSIRAFSNESALPTRWPKYWSFSLSINPSNEYSGLISFRIDWSRCSSRDSQESSLIPQFKSINSLVLSFLYGPTLTSIHDY